MAFRDGYDLLFGGSLESVTGRIVAAIVAVLCLLYVVSIMPDVDVAQFNFSFVAAAAMISFDLLALWGLFRARNSDGDDDDYDPWDKGGWGDDLP